MTSCRSAAAVQSDDRRASDAALKAAARHPPPAVASIIGLIAIVSSLLRPMVGLAQSPPVTPFLSPDHWAVQEARRLAAAGVAPAGFDAGLRSYRIGEVARVFVHAMTAGDEDDRLLAARAAEYHARLIEELGAWLSAAELRASVSVSGGWRSDEGRVLAGVGYSNVDDWTGTVPVKDATGAFGAGWFGIGAGRVAAAIAPHAGPSDTRLDEAHVVVELGPLGVWGGKRAIGYGPGRGGGIVLAGAVPLEGGGLYLARPVTLPWILRYLGNFHLETFGSKLTNGDIVRDPWFWAARASITPHDRITIGFNRGAMFGGDGNAAITARNLFYMLVGEHAGEEGEFANQVMSLDARWRVPLGVPVEAYVEWGFDDTSGGYHRSPGVIAGLYLAAMPGLPSVAVGVERTSFAAASFKNTIWYRNWSLRGGWTHDRRPLGHPLAGHGSEWLAHGSADFASGRVRVAARVALRDRASENLIAPERTGRSTASDLSVTIRTSRWLEITATGRYEDGARDWTESSLVTAVRAWLPGPATATRGADAMTRRAGVPNSIR